MTQENRYVEVAKEIVGEYIFDDTSAKELTLKVATALEEVAREKDAERDDFHRDCRKTLNDLQKQLSEKEARIKELERINEERWHYSCNADKKIASLEAEIKDRQDTEQSLTKWIDDLSQKLENLELENLNLRRQLDDKR